MLGINTPLNIPRIETEKELTSPYKSIIKDNSKDKSSKNKSKIIPLNNFVRYF